MDGARLKTFFAEKLNLLKTRRLYSGRHSPQPSTAGAQVLPESICPVCLNLGNEVWNTEYRNKHGIKGWDYWSPRISGNEALSSIKRGCSSCQIIVWALEPYMAQLERREAFINLHVNDGYGRSIFVVPDDYKGRLDDYLTVVLRTSPYKLKEKASTRSKYYPCPWRYVKPVSQLANSTGSSAAIGKVQAWYSKCLSSHKQCLETTSSPLPTRVIRIEGPARARLHVPGAKHAEYACLSHCWGGQSVMQTTTQNLEQYTVDLPWEELPKTFQDAIQFTYALGFRYLWIDSLCIIQNSIADWRHEGSKMSQIYTNASITLSATWATNPHQGCFVTPKAQYVSRTKTFATSDHETYEIHCHEKLPELEAPLHERGWVFQERMLSRRIVHFMEEELWWECRASFVCECEEAHHKNDIFGVDMNQAAKMSEFHSVGETRDKWERIVETYMTKSLTYPSDIFPGLQGLAKLVPSSMGRYLAGHWMKTLPHSLCWFVKKPAEKQLEEWRAPSWSWAAAQGPVNWFHRGRDDRITAYVTVLRATTSPKGDDPMGQISDGAVLLRGKCLFGQIQGVPASYGRVLSNLVLKGLQLPMSPRTFLCYPSWDYVNREDGMQVIAIKVSEVVSVNSDGKETNIQQLWLILSAIQDVEGEYMRVGMIEESGVRNTGSRLKELNALYEEGAVEMDFKVV